MTFSELIFLIHFDKHRQLYIDLNISKQWDFATMIYHVKDNLKIDYTKLVNISQIFVQLIIFLNRFLNVAKKNYCLIELEITTIIWTIKKIRHLIKFIEILFIVIYIDHSTIILISRQITLNIFSIDKLNLKLMRVS